MRLAGAAERYPTIVADPPWRQKGGPLTGDAGRGFAIPGRGESQPLPYATMTLEEIKALPVAAVAAPDAHLYLWATNKYLPHAFEVMAAWGFTYSTTLVWAKKLMGGGLGGAFGISTEFCLFARRGSLAPLRRWRGTWFTWKRAYSERGKPQSSRKPDAFLDVVEQVSPGPYLELFARRRRLGWDVWGDEAPGSIVLPSAQERAS